MKSILSIVFACIILFQPMSKLCIFMIFIANQGYIAKVLCIQKEVENNTCQGHCQLKKKLKETENEGQKSIPNTLKEKSEVLFCTFGDFLANQFFLNADAEKVFNEFYQIQKPQSFILSFLHPPSTQTV